MNEQEHNTQCSLHTPSILHNVQRNTQYSIHTPSIPIVVKDNTPPIRCVGYEYNGGAAVCLAAHPCAVLDIPEYEEEVRCNELRLGKEGLAKGSIQDRIPYTIHHTP